MVDRGETSKYFSWKRLRRNKAREFVPDTTARALGWQTPYRHTAGSQLLELRVHADDVGVVVRTVGGVPPTLLNLSPDSAHTHKGHTTQAPINTNELHNTIIQHSRGPLGLHWALSATTRGTPGGSKRSFPRVHSSTGSRECALQHRQQGVCLAVTARCKRCCSNLSKSTYHVYDMEMTLGITVMLLN